VAKPHTLHHTPFTVEPGTPAKLHKRDTAATPGFESKAEGKKALAEDIAILAEAQRQLWASRQHSVIVILQAMDAAGKDGAIRHVMSGVNPQGVDVIAFGPPTLDEKLHHFLWRPSRAIPARGRITIFNRSYYEEVLVVRVHPELLEGQWIPRPLKDAPLEDLWRSRYEDINRMESLWVANGTMILKFFLHLGYDEQRDRLLARLDDPAKNWKFSESDIKERAHWKEYQRAFEDAITATSTHVAPWYVIPADHKWFARAAIADIIADRINDLDLAAPEPDPSVAARFDEFRERLKTD
jgi:PPK2 family polyphosphate:nucleotide phosphotransferase